MSISLLIAVICAYLIGSISSAVLICRITANSDPRQVGSKNPGATNVYRVAGKKAAVLTLLADILKGVIPVMIAKEFGMGTIEISIVAIAALLGHVYPVFFKFQGGKGVATVFGALLAFHWSIGVSLLFVWAAVFMLTRTSSLSAIIAALTIPLSSYYILPEALIPLNIIAIIVLWRHYDNILKLFSGEERHFKKR